MSSYALTVFLALTKMGLVNSDPGTRFIASLTSMNVSRDRGPGAAWPCTLQGLQVTFLAHETHAQALKEHRHPRRLVYVQAEEFLGGDVTVGVQLDRSGEEIADQRIGRSLAASRSFRIPAASFCLRSSSSFSRSAFAWPSRWPEG